MTWLLLWQNKDMKERLDILLRIACIAYPLGFFVTAAYLEFFSWGDSLFEAFHDINELLYFLRADMLGAARDWFPLEPILITIFLIGSRYLLIGKIFQK